ncbi:MAG TPA: energy transducer TonB [Smithellaceae bacterium]|nr:energy transducer TonB [Smithellaceae bacterium]
MTENKALSVAFLISFIGHVLFVHILGLGMHLCPKNKNVNRISISFEVNKQAHHAMGKIVRRVEEKQNQAELKHQSKPRERTEQNISETRLEEKNDRINSEIGPSQQYKQAAVETQNLSEQQLIENQDINDSEGKQMFRYQDGMNGGNTKEDDASGSTIQEGKSDMAGVALEAMISYQDMVREKIEQAKIYPLWAKKQGIEGIAHICFTILSDGTGHNVKIVRSSGSNILDEEAVATVKRANPFPPIPKKIKNTTIRVDLAIIFSLKKN